MVDSALSLKTAIPVYLDHNIKGWGFSNGILRVTYWGMCPPHPPGIDAHASIYDTCTLHCYVSHFNAGEKFSNFNYIIY